MSAALLAAAGLAILWLARPRVPRSFTRDQGSSRSGAR
jgi:hypothetical protein